MDLQRGRTSQPHEQFTTILQTSRWGKAESGDPRLRIEPKTLKPGSVSQKCQMKGPVQEMNCEW